MSEPLVFWMGQFAAELPTDRLYSKNHFWAIDQGSGRFRFGFSAYAVRLLQDIYFLEFSVEPGMAIESRQEIGSIESKKAESGLYAPSSGMLEAINPEVLRDPGAINVDKYGDGWLIEVSSIDPQPLLNPQRYCEHLAEAWEVAQRTIKGQANA